MAPSAKAAATMRQILFISSGPPSAHQNIARHPAALLSFREEPPSRQRRDVRLDEAPPRLDGQEQLARVEAQRPVSASHWREQQLVYELVNRLAVVRLLEE